MGENQLTLAHLRKLYEMFKAAEDKLLAPIIHMPAGKENTDG